MKEIFGTAGGVLAIILYVPILYLIWIDKLKQSFATWILWVILDVIALGSIIVKGGDNTFTLKCYVVGGTLVWISLLLKKQFSWGWKESITLLMAAGCMVVWKVSGPTWATIASTLAVCVSGIPQLIESRKEPDIVTARIYIGYAIVSILFFLAGKHWTIEDRFYPAMGILLCGSIAWCAMGTYKFRAILYRTTS